MSHKQFTNAKQEPLEYVIFTPHVKLQIYLSCANGMRNILTYEFLIRLHKDTIWNKRLFFQLSRTYNTGKDKISSAQNAKCVYAKRTCSVYAPDQWQQSEARESEGTRHSQTAATNRRTYTKRTLRTHTRCIHHTKHAIFPTLLTPYKLQQCLYVMCAIRFIRL